MTEAEELELLELEAEAAQSLNIPGVDVSGISKAGKTGTDKIKSPVSDKRELTQRILSEKKAAFRSLPGTDRRVAGLGNYLASLPGVKQATELVTGRDLRDDFGEFSQASAGDPNAIVGGLAGDVATVFNPAMAASKAKLLANFFKRNAAKAAIQGAQGGLVSAGIHQAQELGRTGEINPAMAGVEIGASTLIPGGLSVMGGGLKKAAPDILRTAVKPTLATVDVVNPPDFASPFVGGNKVPYFGGVEGLQKKLGTELKDIYAERAVKAKYAGMEPPAFLSKGEEGLGRGVQLTGEKTPQVGDFSKEVFQKEATLTPVEQKIAEQLKKPVEQPWRGGTRGSYTLVQGNNVPKDQVYKVLKQYANLPKNADRKDMHNMQQEVLAMIRGPGYKLPPSGFRGTPLLAIQDVANHNNLMQEGLATGYGEAADAGLEMYVAKNLPAEFTHGGAYVKRVNTKDPSIVRLQNRDGKVYDFKPGDPVYIDPIRTLPTEKIFQANDYFAYIDEINKAVPVKQKASVSVVGNIKSKLDDEFKDPTKKWLPESKEKALEAVRFWEKQGLGRPSIVEGNMTIEDALAFRQAIDENLDFRAGVPGGLDAGFEKVSQMFRKELNDFIRAKAPQVSELTDKAAGIEPLNKALHRRALQNANNYKMGLLDLSAFGIGAGAGKGQDRLTGKDNNMRALTYGLGALAARRLGSTVGGASMLNDAGSAMQYLSQPNIPTSIAAQLSRYGINQGMQKPAMTDLYK